MLLLFFFSVNHLSLRLHLAIYDYIISLTNIFINAEQPPEMAIN